MVGKLGRSDAVICTTFTNVFRLFGDENGVFGQAWTMFGHCLDRFGHCFGALKSGHRHKTSTSSPMTHCFDVVVAPWWAQWGDHRNKTSTSSPTTGRLKLAVGVALRPPTVDLHTHTRQRRSGKFPNSGCTLPPLKQWGEGFLLNLQIDSRAAMLLEYPGQAPGRCSG